MNASNPQSEFNIGEHHDQRRGMGRFILVAIVLAIILAGLFILGFLPRHQNHARLIEDAKPKVPVVNMVALSREPSTTLLNLPGNTLPWLQTDIYGRTNGYLKQRFVDIGDHVHQGQVLATIETPEVDQELSQAKATLAQVKAALVQQQTTLDFSKITLARYKNIPDAAAVSREDVDQRQLSYNSSLANVSAARAVVKANQANINRLEAFQVFKKVVAPFSGVITQRNVDAGALITAGGSSTSTYLFEIMQTDTLRIWIDVPQTYATEIHKGMEADVKIAEFPNQVFHGIVNRTSNSLDPKTRTLRTEIKLKNVTGQILPGMFSYVSLVTAPAKRPVVIPDTTLIADAKGTRVALVRPDNTVHYETVVLGRDFGTEIEVLSGLTGQEHLISNPADTLVEGATVKPVLVKLEPMSKS